MSSVIIIRVRMNCKFYNEKEEEAEEREEYENEKRLVKGYLLTLLYRAKAKYNFDIDRFYTLLWTAHLHLLHLYCYTKFEKRISLPSVISPFFHFSNYRFYFSSSL